jgi:hypothetical protein
MPEPTGKPTPIRPSPGREPARSDDGLGPLQVRYFRRMRPQRVYGVTVGWPRRDERRAPPGTPPVMLRLLMAGAQVVPAELPLDPANPDAKATFYVTPIARGWLRNERLEVLVGGRKVQEVPLPSKVGGQGLTWTFLLLALLVPWFLLSYGKYSPLQLNKQDIRDSKQVQKLRDFQQRTVQNDKDPVAAAQAFIPELRRHPGQVLTDRLERELPDYLSENAGVYAAIDKVGDLYDNLVVWQTVEKHPIAFYAFVGFLVLALLSFILNQDRRTKRMSRPIALPRGAEATTPRREALAAEVE